MSTISSISVDWTRFVCRLAVVLALSLASGCVAPTLLSPEIRFNTDRPQPLRVGVSAISITPTGSVHLAGGIPYRPSLNIHDDLWARAVVIENGVYRVVFVALDLIGVFYEDVVRIRMDIASQVDADYVLIASTHTHNAPDVLGAWSPCPLCIDDPYRIFLGQQVALAVTQAVANLRPARIRVAAGTSGDPNLSRDTRLPKVIDDTLTVWQAIDTETDDVIATSVHYAAHPILIPSFNFDISSDFVHYLRVAVESGMNGDAGPVEPQGGLCLFFNGDLGGKISPANAEPLVEGPPVEPAYERAQGYGYRLARRVQELLTNEAEWLNELLTVSVATRQIRVPMENPLLTAAIRFCALERALPDGHVHSEVGVVRVGPLEFFAVPGMIFPELVLGSVTPLPGSDFPDAPAESPALAELATDGSYFIVMGIANDMLGYLIPKAQWDSEPPYTTDDNKAPYGEIISAGADAAGVVLEAFTTMAGDLAPTN